MAVAAIVALVHDLIITVGIYALIGFEVTPATVIGFLTILGYSLYDTVVVFDKVRENTAEHHRRRPDAPTPRAPTSRSTRPWCGRSTPRSSRCCRSARSCSSASFLLGAGPLKDLALALFVGMAAGAYSSIFIATPLLAQLKEREPAMKAPGQAGRDRRAADARPSRMVVRDRGRPRRQPASDRDAVEDDGRDGARRAAAGAPTQPRPRSAPRPMSSQRSKRAQPQRQARSKRGKR